MFPSPPSRRRSRKLAFLAGALITLPLALSADVTASWLNAANSVPLHAAPRYYRPGDLGASGAAPHDTEISPQLLHDAANPSALLTDAGPMANLPSGPLGIPGVVLDAYLHAQQVLGAESPSCHLPWWLLAGIGKIESNQAENGEVDSAGMTLRPILGPLLNGGAFAAIPDTDGGRWDGNTQWDRAVGPMQFLPSTWRQYGGSGNPNNVYDAAVAAGRYLCASGRDLSNPVNQAIAVFSYNHSDSYVRMVLIWANAYAQGVTPQPETTVPTGPLPPAQQASAPLGGGTPAPPGGGAGGTTTGTVTGPTPPGSTGPGSTTATTPGSTPTTPSRTTTPPPPPTTTTTPPPTCPTTTTPPTSTTPPPPTTTTPPPSGCPTPPATSNGATTPTPAP